MTLTSDAESPDALHARFGLAGTLIVRAGPGGLCFADVDNVHAQASICLQGAQLLHWQPRTQALAVLWLSESARYLAGKAVRGGIPVCWPWFGAAPAAAPQGAPAHGFARTQPWRLAATAALPDGRTWLRLVLEQSAATHAWWSQSFSLALEITVGTTLTLRLVTGNTGTLPLVITEALHSYFRVGDITRIGVCGLDQAPYFDAVLGQEQAAETGTVMRFAGEVDRIYDRVDGRVDQGEKDGAAHCRIDDPVLGRRIHITQQGSASTVVWNPWQAKAERLGDLGPAQPPHPDATSAWQHTGWQQMVCVESGNARHRAVRIEPGQSHTLGVQYRVANADPAAQRNRPPPDPET